MSLALISSPRPSPSSIPIDIGHLGHGHNTFPLIFEFPDTERDPYIQVRDDAEREDEGEDAVHVTCDGGEVQ